MTQPPSNIPPPAPTSEDAQGSLGAILIGAAILLIAGLLIFWPGGSDSTTGAQGANASSQGGQQSAHSADGRSAAGQRGIAPRESDPAKGRVSPHVRSGLIAPSVHDLAMMPTPPPEPTSFASLAEEIAYYEKKLQQAQVDLEARTTFLERMRRKQSAEPVSDHDRNVQRANIVQKNYDSARARVTELEQKLAFLRGKHSG